MTSGSNPAMSGTGADNETHEHPQLGVHNIAARDGYDPGDGYMLPNPQLWSQTSATDPRSGGPESGPAHQRPRRRDSISSESEDDDDEYRRGRYGRSRGSQALRRYKSYEGRQYYDDDDDDDYNKEGRGREQNRGSLVRRSMSRMRTTISDLFGGDEDEDGKGNTETKKWAATVSGALVGGLAARQARKDHWVPAAIGAFIGGFAARELEKNFYRRKAAKREEEEPYRGRGAGSRSRSRSGSRSRPRG